MASYIVMEQPGRNGPADIVFPRDGFSWLAFLVPPLWLLWHALWVETVLAFLVLGSLWFLGEAGWPFAAAPLTLAVSLIVGLEGPNLRIAALRRRGWRPWGVVEAGTLFDAETRHAAEQGGEEAGDGPEPAPRIVPGPAPARAPHTALVLGLGPVRGRT